ncbi:putative bifunctional diguanylate cyclase/phosphodiesterase [Modestobacter sp. SYSU DS0290]
MGGTGRDVAGLRRTVLVEFGVVALLTLALGVASVVGDLPATLARWSQGPVPVDHLVVLLAGSHLFMIVFGARRGAQLKREAHRRACAESDLSYRAGHDLLTGLLSRDAFTTAVADALAREVAPSPAVLFIDLDGFGDLNATLGHDTANDLLRAVGARLTAEAPAGARVARVGGDEFGVLLTGPAATDPGTSAAGLLTALQQPVQLGDLALDVSACAGLAAGPASDPMELLRRADVAFAAARARRTGLVVYSPAIDTFDAERLVLHGELRRAVGAGELRLHYQPQVCLRTGRVVGVEGLLRWEHPRRGLLLPGSFIDLAEHTGLIRELTDAVLAQAVSDSRAWADAGRPLRIAVNLSARSLGDLDLPGRIATLLREAGVAPEALELEITETAVMDDPERALEVLHQLRSLGVGLSVDDFGTGHASLAYLTQLPVQTLKIDRSFVMGMLTDAGSRTIVKALVGLAHDLGLRVVAEGVETAATWRALHAMRCDEIQGFWLGGAIPAAGLPALIVELEHRLRAHSTTS